MSNLSICHLQIYTEYLNILRKESSSEKSGIKIYRKVIKYSDRRDEKVTRIPKLGET